MVRRHRNVGTPAVAVPAQLRCERTLRLVVVHEQVDWSEVGCAAIFNPCRLSTARPAVIACPLPRHELAAVPPRARAVPSSDKDDSGAQGPRDGHIQLMAERGRMGW